MNSILKETKARQESDKTRYGKWYGFDHTKHEHYDLIIDSTNSNVQEITEQMRCCDIVFTDGTGVLLQNYEDVTIKQKPLAAACSLKEIQV